MGQGGADRVTLTLLRTLDRRSFRPALILMRSEGALLAELPDDVPVHDLGSASLWTAWWPLARTLRRLGPDTVFSTSSGANLIAVIGARLCGRETRLVLSERNVLYRDQGRIKRWLLARLKRWLYPRADCVTAVSRGVAEDLTRRLDLPPSRIRVVYNPVVTPEIPSLAAAASPHAWLAEQVPVVLGVGRLVRAKGFDLLLDAFADLQRPARLILLGEGPLRGVLGRQARDLGVEDRVWFAPYDPNPFRYMARCTVFALSSRHEGLPGALIQAMACGAAVVASDCAAGPSEIVEDGVSGLLVPVADRQAMVAAIDGLLTDSELRLRIGRRAPEAVRRFSLEEVLEGYVEVLSEAPERNAG
jgi:glycosyltransferase involved in cell wall biosynthesis